MNLQGSSDIINKEQKDLAQSINDWLHIQLQWRRIATYPESNMKVEVDQAKILAAETVGMGNIAHPVFLGSNCLNDLMWFVYFLQVDELEMAHFGLNPSCMKSSKQFHWFQCYIGCLVCRDLPAYRRWPWWVILWKPKWLSHGPWYSRWRCKEIF